MRFTNQLYLWISLVLIQPVLLAQNSEPAQLTIVQAEELFFKNNFLLLAQQYNINQAEAQIVQAKVYPNPEFSLELVGYDGQNNKFLHVANPDGQYAGGIEQLILLGGKRSAQIKLAKIDKKKAEAELTDLTRNLQLEIAESFYTLHNHLRLIEKYTELLEKLETLILSYETQVSKNNIPLKDLVRLKSVYVKINNDKSEEMAVQIELQQKLGVLLGITVPIKTVYTSDNANAFANYPILYDELVRQSITSRPDLAQLQLDIESAKQNISLQRKLAIPDVTVRAGYNRNGDAFQDQVNIGLGIPIPLFDRNEGNIKTALIEEEKLQRSLPYKQLQIESEVLAAFQNFSRSVDEYRRINRMINQDFDLVFTGMNSNFQKGNVSMIEFADFFESYNEAQTEVERVKKQLALAAAQINYVSGTKNF
jgi:cobalt-zinc-cadmium efflux system outer membrane protein